MTTDSFNAHNPKGESVCARTKNGCARPICLITHEFYPKHGGIATFSEEIAHAASTLGYDIEVWAQDADRNIEKQWPFSVRRLPLLRGTHNIGCRLRIAWELIIKRRLLRNAIVYMPEPGPLLAMMALQFFSGFLPEKLVVTFHGSEILRFHRNPVRRALTRRLIRNAWRVSTLTRYTRELLYEYFPEARGKTILSPGAVRNQFALNGSHAGTPRGGGRIDSTPPFAMPERVSGKLVVLTVGRIHPRKGQLHTLRALQALPADVRANVEYWVAGKTNGSDYEKNLRKISAPGNGLAVRFLGEVPDHQLGDVYKSADIFAMTSVPHEESIEGFGLVYLDAAAHGLPVIAHDVGGVAEAVVDGITGMLVPPQPGANGDASPQLTAAFEKLLGDKSLRGRMGAAGRAHALGGSWNESAKMLFATDDMRINGAGHYSPAT